MKSCRAVVEYDKETGFYVDYIPGFPGAHSQEESLDQLKRNLKEVIEMLTEEGEPPIEIQMVDQLTLWHA